MATMETIKRMAGASLDDEAKIIGERLIKTQQDTETKPRAWDFEVDRNSSALALAVETYLDTRGIPCYHVAEGTISIGKTWKDLLEHENTR